MGEQSNSRALALATYLQALATLSSVGDEFVRREIQQALKAVQNELELNK